MRKVGGVLLVGLMLIFGLALQAQAFNVIYGGSDTNYSVTSVDGHAVFEDYNAKSWLPFSSHDGYAVVDFTLPNLEPAQPIFFDKVMTFTQNDPSNNFEVTFHVTNTSPYPWSDYHFILSGVPDGLVFTSGQSDDLKGVTVSADGLEVDLFAGPPGSKLIDPDKTGVFNLSMTVPEFTGELLTADLRQVATTSVPLPSAAPLLGTGLGALGLMAWRRR